MGQKTLFQRMLWIYIWYEDNKIELPRKSEYNNELLPTITDYW